MLAGQLITGDSLSVTVTLKVHDTELPQLSVAVYVTDVVPAGKVSPELCELTITGELQLSLKEGAVQVTVAPQVPGALFTVMSAGHPVTVGAVASVIVMVCVNTAATALPQSSETVHVLV
jgi:hypothetical protein